MKNPRFDFLSSARLVTTLSLVLSAVALIWIVINGLNYGIDFAGGNEIQIRFKQPPAVEQLRKYVSEKGFNKPSVQLFGDEQNEFLIFIENISTEEDSKEEVKSRDIDSQGEKPAGDSGDVAGGDGDDGDAAGSGDNVAGGGGDANESKLERPTGGDQDTDESKKEVSSKGSADAVDPKMEMSSTEDLNKEDTFSGSGGAIENLISSFKRDFAGQGVEIRKVDSVGPQIGSELRKKGILAVFYSLIMILVYLAIRFDYKFAPAAVICLFHDTILTMWVFALFDLVVSVQTLAALLAIIGYSLNDTIVTFDRIRENGEYFAKKESFLKLCNRSINDVLSRTLLTSITTMMAIGVMWFYTDGVIKDFAFTLGVGVVIGTYSSIYVATPLVVFISHLEKRRKTVSR